MVAIVEKNNPVLRQKADPVSLKEIGSKNIQNILKQMREVLASQEDGVAIAAPQIGESLRIFLVSNKILPLKNGMPENEIVCINPVLIKLSRKKGLMEEGCLSVRWLYGDVLRATKATVRAYDAAGNLFTRGASGLLAQIFQHETDHLDGILFIDKAHNLRELPPQKRSANSKEPLA